MTTKTASAPAETVDNPGKQGAAVRPEPMGYRESLSRWWNSPNAENAERAILSLTPFFPESDGRRTAQSHQIDIGDGLHLNEFEITNTEGEGTRGPDRDLVVLHGYGAGLGLFFQNFDAWSSLPGSRVFALDLLGFGRSSRPKFNIHTKDTSAQDENGEFPAVKETEAWFIDSIEKWRQKKGLESFTLMGHSLGGYIAAAYTLEHPERVHKLIMVSPAGVERGYKPELEEKTLFKSRRSEARNAPQFDEEIIEENASSSSSDNLTNELSTTTRQLPSYFQFLWNSHISPFSILRSSMFFAPKLVSRWTNRRFGTFPDSTREAMLEYVYKIFTAKPSGEYALTRILASGAVARMPMINRVPGALKCPSTWIYGDNDWMNVHAGEETVARLRRNGATADFHTVPSAGHHVYLDNPKGFNKILLDFMKR